MIYIIIDDLVILVAYNSNSLVYATNLLDFYYIIFVLSPTYTTTPYT